MSNDDPEQSIGDTARLLDAKPIRERVQLERQTLGKLAVFASGYVALLWVVIRYLGLPASSAETAVGTFVPMVVVLAFAFETLDSAAGMGFGTALAPLLFAFGYDPLAVTPVLLISESITGVIAGWMHNEFKNMDLSPGWPPSDATKLVGLVAGSGIAAIAVSIVLTYVGVKLPSAVIETYVAVLVLAMGVVGLARQFLQPSIAYRPKRMVGFAILAGFNKGIGGGGYGPVVTLGEIYSGVYEKSAAAITATSEGIVSVAGVVVFFGITMTGVELDFVLLPSLLAGSLLAGVAGPYMVRVMPNRLFRYVIPTYAFLIGVFALTEIY